MNPDPYEDYYPLQSFVDEAGEAYAAASEAEIVDPLPLQSFVDEEEEPTLRLELARQTRDAIASGVAATALSGAAAVIVTLPFIPVGAPIAVASVIQRLFAKGLEGADAAQALRQLADAFEAKGNRDS